MKEKETVLVIAGPTASGKTGLSVNLCLTCRGEVVSADSMQIYKGMDIGTAKPTQEERRGVMHHLMDMVDPDMPYSVADWQEAAKCRIEEILSRGRLPVVTGGTGLYISSLIHNLGFSESVADLDYREEMRKFAEKEGAEALHERLCRLDPEAAMAIHPNNQVRVIRALEIIRATGECIAVHHARSREQPSPWKYVLIGLAPERPVLYERIERRVDEMVKAGLADEVAGLLDRGYHTSLQSMQGIGYKEMAACLLRGEPPEAAVEAIKMATRRYAKRQMTWFSRLENMHWLDSVALGPESMREAVLQTLGNGLEQDDDNG